MATGKAVKRRPRSNDAKPRSRVPKTFSAFVKKHPDLAAAHEDIARAVDRSGPLDAKTCALIKIGISLGAGLESAVRSHARRAAEHGATRKEIEQAVLLAMNTVGFPRTVAAWQWVCGEDQR